MDNKFKRTYHIVIYQRDPELDALAINKIVHFFDHVLVIHSINELKPIILDNAPKVVFFSNENIETSFQQYYQLIEGFKPSDLCEHKFVAFCNKKDEDTAFAAYNTDIIDEYLVSRPLYEVTRPILLAKQLLRELGVHFASNGQVEYSLTQLQLKEELNGLIESTLEKKKALKEGFEQSIIKLDTAITKAQDKFAHNKKAELNLDEIKQLLSQIKSNEIRPELLELQNKALSLLNKFVTGTNGIVAQMTPNESSHANSPDTDTSKNATNTPTAQTKANATNNTDGTKPAKKKQSQVHIPEDIDYESRINDLQKVEKIKVLLVEDDEISLNLSAKLFKNKRFDFEYAISGRDAINKLSLKKFDIVFMDINLPDSDGLSIVSQLTQNNSLNVNTPIVVLTGNHSKLSIKRAGQVGAKTYLIKPLRQSSLAKALEKCNLA